MASIESESGSPEIDSQTKRSLTETASEDELLELFAKSFLRKKKKPFPIAADVNIRNKIARKLVLLRSMEISQE